MHVLFISDLDQIEIEVDGNGNGMSRDSVVRVDGLHYLVARKVAGEGAVAGRQGPSRL